MPKKAKPSSDRPRYRAKDRYKWLELQDDAVEGDTPSLHVRIRAELSVDEADTIVFGNDTPVPDVWDMTAPFVVDWNLDDENGEPVPPPAEGGGKNFRYISNPLFWKLFAAIKIGVGGNVEAKSWKPSLPMDGSDGATTLSVIGSNETAS